MKNAKLYEGMTDLYSLSKTLRFELKPQYETLSNINMDNIMLQDKKRKENYLEFKKLSDEVFKEIIVEQLELINLDLTQLISFKEALLSKDTKELKVISKKLMVNIDKQLNQSEKLKKMYGKEILDLISQFCEANENYTDCAEIVESFKGFTTYFLDYIENRKNIFNHKTEETSIAHRIINENLPIFIKNKIIFDDFIKQINNKAEMEEKISAEFDKMGIEETLENILSMSNFTNVLTQEGIEQYNLIISGIAKEDEAKVKGLNELMNLYKQQHSEEKIKFVKMQKLRKQILLDSSTESFVFDVIEDDTEVISVINSYYESIETLLSNSETDTFKLFADIINEDPYKMYIENKNINEISRIVYGDFGYIKHKLKENYIKEFVDQGKKINENNLTKYLKRDFYTFAEILAAFDEEEVNKFYKHITFSFYSNSNIEDLDDENYNPKMKYLDKIKMLRLKVHEEFNSSGGKGLLNNENAISAIKTLLDELKSYQIFLSLFKVENFELISESSFYSFLNYSYDVIALITPIYNKVRNYLTQKPFSTEKIKLNFGNQQLLAGWSKSKEADCLGTIFIRDDKYYLGIINKNTSQKDKIFNEEQFEEDFDIESYFEKVDLFMLADPKRDFPKKYFSAKWQQEHDIPEDILAKYEKYKENKGDEYQKDKDYHKKLINFYQEQLRKTEDWQVYDFKYKTPSEYEHVNEFLDEIGRQAYKFNLRKIPVDYIRELVKQNKLYFFQIYSKDFAPGRKGRPDLQTLYFKAIFNELNFVNYNYKLSGFAEIFYRPASLERKITHPKGIPIKKKNPNAIGNKESVFEYDLIKNKRYTEDKFLLHIPIEMNRLSDDLEFEINNIVLKNIYDNQDNKKYILGIDRGERHLIYLVLIDETGKIIKQETLNVIKNNYTTSDNRKETIKTDYHRLLSEKQAERIKSKQDWKMIENIKELKSGYLSNVINKILQIMIEYQPIIIFENLNSGFKNSRIKIEKQVYQKFEKALISKLNYIVRKDLEYQELGGLFNPIQLTRQYSEKYKGKQNGILFYVPASYTSNIDPVTGFMPFIYTKYENVAKSKDIINTFNEIKYLENEDMFKFVADYTKFRPEAKYWDRKIWDLYTNGTRIKTYRDKEQNFNWVSKEVKIVDEFKNLFEEYNINFKENLKEQILIQDDKKFFETILYLIKLTQQLRNSETGTDKDYIISPIKNQTGDFFDSRNSISTLPENADANGAYNIARKGLLVLENIKAGVVQKDICNISFEEWFKYIEEKNV